ncbi:MAG TPA: MarR family transcriptional regulator [Solirubrobacterales bacterium]|nr:MarR family transcriptional regulator [Solirubrobacterales bacterium]
MDKAATAKSRKKASAGDTGREAWGLLSSLVYPPPFLPLVRELDLRPATFGALRLLEQPRTMSQLADLLHCDNSNVTGIVDNLEEKDLAIRYPSEVDRRIKVVELTVKGEVLMRRVRRELAKPPEWVKDLSVEDQAALRDILQRAADARNA